MTSEEPFVIHGTHGLDGAALAAHQERYGALLASGVPRERDLAVV